MEGLRKQAYRDKMRELGKTLRHRLVIQKRNVTKDPWGNQVEEWQDWQTVWANLQTLWGERYYAAKAVGEENTVIFELRRAPFLDELIRNVADYRLESITHHRGTVYTILRVDQLPGEAWVKLTCEESKPHG